MTTDHVFSFDFKSIKKIKKCYKAGDPKAATDVALLLKDADQALCEGPFSVTFKEAVAPSGDKHDYVSLSRYKWPTRIHPMVFPMLHAMVKAILSLRSMIEPPWVNFVKV